MNPLKINFCEKFQRKFKSEHIQTHTDFTDSYRLTLYYYYFIDKSIIIIIL